MINAVLSEVNNITVALVKAGLTIRENFAIRKDLEIVWDRHKDISVVFDQKPYSEIYDSLLQFEEYNLVMLDGALIQVMYTFGPNGAQILKHRLAFYPRPNTREMPAASLELPIQSLPTTLRFDFDRDQTKNTVHFHSKSHCTLGNREDSRVTANREITPNQFFSFILRAFYADACVSHEMSIAALTSTSAVGSTILLAEQNHIHFNVK